MGGRGGSSGFTANSKVVTFPSKEKSNNNSRKWDYRGFVQRTDSLEKAVNEANTRKKVQTVFKGLRDHDKNITAELDRIASGVKDAGDEKALMTERRRTRLLIRKIKFKGIL